MLETRIRQRLESFELNGLSRRLLPPAGIDLSSNDYLQFASHPMLRARMSSAVLQEGCGSTGSRLLRGDRNCFSAIEQRFAAFKGTEAALYFSSGYAANLAVLSTFLDEGDVVFFDRLNHASLIDGMRLGKARKILFAHSDLAAFDHYLRTISTTGQRFLVVESLFSMDGDIAPLKEYADLCREAGVALIVDEAHAIGLYGDRGTGLIESTGIAGDTFLSINPAGKALGLAGAFVAGPQWAIDYLMQRGRTFVFSTAPPPSIAAALGAALDLIGEAPELRHRLHCLTTTLRGMLVDQGLDIPRDGTQIIPVLVGDNARAVSVAQALQVQGFDVRAIRPPAVPEGSARLRISVNTGLDETILRRFSSSLDRALSGVGER
ncbi:MAG TPA: 8-amino-7-oxononanoate synthase [Terracidiphilus sp.]